MERARMSYSAEVKSRVVEEIESGGLSLREASERCRTKVSVIKLWLEEYGRFKPKRDIVEVVMKSEEDRIRELEKALAEATLKLRISDEIIRIASKKYKTDLKKSFGTEGFEEPGGRATAASKRPVKR